MILSPQSIESNWVKKEVEMALIGEISGKKIEVLPILWRKCEIPGFLRGKVYANLSTPQHYKKNLPRIIHKISGQEYRDIRLRIIIPDKPVAEGSKMELAEHIYSLLDKKHPLSKRYWKYSLINISGHNITLKDVELDDDNTILINCNVSRFDLGYQDQGNGGGIALSEDDAMILLYRTESGRIRLSPAGEKLKQLLLEWKDSGSWNDPPFSDYE